MMKATSAKTKPEITAVDLFCGVGGLTHGLLRGGIDVVAGIDLDSTCRYPFEANNPARFFRWNVKDLTASTLKELLDGSSLTLLAGCAPCQPFSTYSRSRRKERGGSDWELVESFGRLVREVQPHFVTMENVPAVENHPVFKRFLECLGGYHTVWDNIDCSKIGVPQTRKRLVLLASKLGAEGLSLPTGNEATATVRSAIAHLPKLKAGEADLSDPLHIACRLSILNLKRIKASRPGGTWRDWSPPLRAACHLKSTGNTYPSVYGRMEWDKPAPTITTQCFGYGNGRFGHPEQDRAITLREAAMLQTFPSDYAFVPGNGKLSVSLLGRLIGNAVPVRLGEVIGKTLCSHARTHASAAISTFHTENERANH
uniref:DNA (cytosine-5-)-methyltransferase n=1 Tax=Candidatus Kentrum sp. DK TaxID=2126562 RepID=A0A450T381_9GAMM|nr:MAG: DNA (cytosine-5)-methyltransferase 1 [Candidatus Kentron sp. DK]